jgi:cell division initiation protein
MAITPLDIHHKEFRTARFGGYNEEDVDSFLDQVADELEKVIQENSELKQQLEIMRKRLSEFEEMQTSLQSALLAATKSAEAVREQARQEAEALVAKAQEEADSLIRSAQEQARQMILRAQNERQKMERSLARLREVKNRYLASIREIAREHLAQVEQLESREEAELLPEEPPTLKDVIVNEQAVQEKRIPQVRQEPQAAVPPTSPPTVSEVGTLTSSEKVKEEQATDEGLPKDEKEEEAEFKAESGNEIVEDVSAKQPGQPEELKVVKEEHPTKGETPSSSNLVDEVLAMEEGSEIYSPFLDEKETEESKGRKSRKERKEKHFFWE